jgi:hypothetical protein
MPRPKSRARLWLRPARRKNGKLIANAIWIIIDGDRHFATGCLKDQVDQAERKLADYIAEKYRPPKEVRGIAEIDIADVLSIYWEDCGPRMADPPKLARCIGRLNNYWAARRYLKSPSMSAMPTLIHGVRRVELALILKLSAQRSIIMPSKTCILEPSR